MFLSMQCFFCCFVLHLFKRVFFFFSEYLLAQIVWDNKKLCMRQFLVNRAMALGELLTFTTKEKPQSTV